MRRREIIDAVKTLREALLVSDIASSIMIQSSKDEERKGKTDVTLKALND
jgi:hypothetical protein